MFWIEIILFNLILKEILKLLFIICLEKINIFIDYLIFIIDNYNIYYNIIIKFIKY